MAIEFACPECRAPLRFVDDLAGKISMCPDCGRKITVPRKVHTALPKRITKPILFSGKLKPKGEG